jgi:hypothetical protein
MNKKYRKKPPYRWAISITIWTFLLAALISLASQLLTGLIESIAVSIVILLIIILIGIFGDIIGIAATAAEEKPFHAKAAKKVLGAKEAIFFVRNADMVSNFSNDVIGDISGIVSGTLGALIVFQIRDRYLAMNTATLSILLTAVIASLTVGGKALGKTLAISRSTEIILLVSSVIKRLKKVIGR